VDLRVVCIILPANRGTGQPPQNTTTDKVTGSPWKLVTAVMDGVQKLE